MSFLTKSLKAAAIAGAFAMSFAPAQAADFLNHAAVAENLVTQIDKANNKYQTGETTVSLVGYLGATSYVSKAACAPWVSQILAQVYGLTNAQMTARFTSTSPSSAVFNSQIEKQAGFTKITRVADIARGDIMAIVYNKCGTTTTATGHTAMIARAPIILATERAPFKAGTRQWSVEIYDSTSSAHGTAEGFVDVRRSSDGTGAGIGFMRLYEDTVTGNLVGYTWSMSATTAGSYFAVGETADCTRSMAIGRMK